MSNTDYIARAFALTFHLSGSPLNENQKSILEGCLEGLESALEEMTLEQANNNAKKVLSEGDKHAS